jgi:AraC-like DNA-binding protein
MSLAAWRQHVRLLEAVARLACGHAVTSIAYDVGYESPSAFNCSPQPHMPRVSIQTSWLNCNV